MICCFADCIEDDACRYLDCYDKGDTGMSLRKMRAWVLTKPALYLVFFIFADYSLFVVNDFTKVIAVSLDFTAFRPSKTSSWGFLITLF